MGGLIPARAGKTRSSTGRAHVDSAHPRAGGENAIRAETVDGLRGSSPRGRGKLGQFAGGELGDRLIPARAGKTPSQFLASSVAGAHPRAGGENASVKLPTGLQVGSSPRGRGKHSGYECGGEFERLIPARAGKTCRLGGRDRYRAAHPRAGGENIARGEAELLGAGSSPRGRGKPL